MLTAPGTAWRRQAPLLLHPQGLARRVHHHPCLHERKKSEAWGWGEQSGAGQPHTSHFLLQGSEPPLTTSDSNTYKPVVKCHNPSHGTAHSLLTCRDSGQSTALRTEKGDITTRRAAAYRRFACVTCNLGSALSPSSFCSSFRSRLPEGSTKLSACPPGGPCLWLLLLTNLVLPVLRSSCHPDAPSG